MASSETKEINDNREGGWSYLFNYLYFEGKVRDIFYQSGEVEKIFGISREEFEELLLNNKVWETFMIEDVREVEKKLDRIIKSGKPGELRYRINKGGEIRWIEEKLFPNTEVKDGYLLSGIVHDITDKLRAEQEIAISEQKFRRLFERNMAGVYVTHLDGRILNCNPAFARILGYDSPEEILSKKVYDLYFDSDERKKYLSDLREKGSLNNYITVLKRKDGRRLVLDNNVSINEDENGELNIIEGTFIDVTDLKETTEKLKIGEHKYRTLFEEANNAILLINSSEEGNYIIDCNEKALATFRCKENEIIGIEFVDICCSDSLKEKKVDCYAILDSERSQLEWQFIRLDGEVFDAEIWLSKISMGTETINQIVISDVSSRKQKEKELLQSRQSFKNIVDSSLAAIFIFTQEKLVYLNPIGNQLFRSLLNTDSDNLFEIFPKQYTPLFTQLLSEAENDIHSYTELTLGEDNNSKNYSINVVEIIHNNEKSQLVILRDITLQNEYNFQKHRAEIAEIANEKLQEEIERHKKTQEELLEKTSKLRAFNESAHSLFALTIDRDYRLTSVNTNFIKEVKILLEIEPKIGDLFLDLFKTDEEGVKAFHHKFEQTFKGDQQEIISHFPSNKGEYWVESFFYPILVEGEEIKEISIIAHDITERIEIQRQIKRSEASNRATLLAIPDFIFRLNSEGVFTDSRIRNGTLGALEQFVSTEDFTGKSINEIFLNEKIAREFTDNLKIALSGEGLHTQHFSFYVDENKRFFENRFSKINDEEVVVISRDITESMEYESRLIKSVREKEILLKEVHHRVKNNLQVINSILNLQSSYVDDPQTLEIINESQNRIRSMSYIHESLYQTKDFNSIDFYDYVTNLVQNLVHSYQMTGENIELDLDVERVSLALDQAIPCGLILNELISNALKYAYEPDDSNAIIQIGIKEKDRKVQVVVEDFGKGLPKDFNIYQTETLGLSLVESLVDQLDGELICKRERGTKFLIIFEKQEF